MRLSPQAILCFEAQAKRHLISAEISSCRKVVELFTVRPRLRPRCNRSQRRGLSIVRSSSLQQAAPAPVPQAEFISGEPSLDTLSSPWPSPPATPKVSAPKVSTQADLSLLLYLPSSCPGCGGLTQEVDNGEAGFYTSSRRSVKDYIRRVKRTKVETQNVGIRETVKEDPSQRGSGDGDTIPRSRSIEPPHVSNLSLHTLQQDIPYCDRCHELLHQSKGVPIAHPTLDSIADTIVESPHRRNHVYHVLDAADFPMSLLPQIFNRLTLARPRSQNRRSQHDFSPRTTISFIITRSDLLAPQKEMVDSLMPYITSVLRQALGRRGRDMRLGNVHLVSAKRGWWTKEIKEAIRERGGGNWMVGKFNVGKSNLFEVLFPKGDGEQAPVYGQLQRESGRDALTRALESPPSQVPPHNQQLLHESSLLPPAQPQTPYPTMPLVSSLPGTTASPIRLPFGPTKRPKGELIDLPGLARSYLSDYVVPGEQRSLVMEYRPTVHQHVLKPGQSLLLGGGLIRLTPHLDPGNPDEAELIFLVYPFTPLPAHATATTKAEMCQFQQRESGIKSILAPGAGDAIHSAGVFALDTDVTKVRSGAMLRAGVKMEQLPFRVKATDVLIAGIGWVEVVCQVRRRRRTIPKRYKQPAAEGGSMSTEPQHGDALSHLDSPPPPLKPFSQPISPSMSDHDPDPDFPTPCIEVYHPSPHPPSTKNDTSTTIIAQRRPMNAWMLMYGARRPGQTRPRKATAASLNRGGRSMGKGRPRKSMKGAKKREKTERRRRIAEQGGAE